MSSAARIFISYRTSDGMDKATALARDLNAVFGEAQVFLDKEDLPAGQPWREAIGAALDDKPVLLLLITPQLLGPRLEDANDPVRRELAAALEFGADVIPVLGDGVERLPEAHEWPAAMHALSERTWRRLRAYDWREDVLRLVADLQALGVQRADGAAPAPAFGRRRAVQLALASMAGALAGGGSVFWWLRRGDAGAQATLTGAWRLRVAAPANESGSRLDAVTLHVTHSGEDVKLYSEPIDITQDPAWTGFAQQWHERFGNKLERVVWRGAGRARLEQGSAPAIDVGLRVETPAGSEPIDTGNLAAELSADGQRMSGRLWMNGEQAERRLEMARGRAD
jgi:TIR domain